MLKVELAAPGMTKKDFSININEDHNLVITMEKQQEDKDEKTCGCRYLRREFSYSKFQQTLILPDDVVSEKITAGMEHGVLTINLPKVTPEEKVQTIKTIPIQ